jgi:hypothetical protein
MTSDFTLSEKGKFKSTRWHFYPVFSRRSCDVARAIAMPNSSGRHFWLRVHLERKPAPAGSRTSR